LGAQQFVNNAQKQFIPECLLEDFVVVLFPLNNFIYGSMSARISFAVLPIISQKSKRLILIN